MRYDLGLSVFFAWCKLTELGSIFFKYGICLNDLYILLYGLKVTFSVLREENMIHPNVLTWTEDLSQVSAVVTWWSSLSFLLEHLTVDGVKVPTLQLHIMDGPLHQVCIKVTKASYRDQVISLEQGQEKVPAYPPHPSALGQRDNFLL